jgi:TolA-binding protein
MRTAEITTPVSPQGSRRPILRGGRPQSIAIHRFVLLAILAVGPAVLTASLGAQEGSESTQAQGPSEAEKGLIYQRRVQLPQGVPLPAVVMTEFFTHGELDAKGASLAVHDNRRNPVPWRVLQVGPGDYCRIAFQTVPKQSLYKIYYGPRAEPQKPPAWTSEAGLVLETRHWRSCDLSSLDSVREALRASEAYGSAFVPSVFHRFNPFWPDPEPFLSEYRGMLRISRPGRHRFFTSSQDCSFLRIDGKPVVAAPGWHGPVGDARFQGEIDLSAGAHEFLYIHAAAGADACMVAAWQPPGSARPEPIPPEAFGSEAIARYPAIGVRHWREFAVDIAGEVPLADSPWPLIRAQFRFVSARGSAARPKVHWDFGDGQAGTQTDPVHIYLHPGLYTVTMKVSGESDALAVVNRVPIRRALIFAQERQAADTLASYLAILDRYNPAKLDPAGLLQLVRACGQAGLAGRAAKLGEAGILSGRELGESEDSLAVVRQVGALLRDRLDDPKTAFAFWQGAIKALRPEPWKAECEVEAADVALNLLLRQEEAKRLLDSASARLGHGGDTALIGKLDRVWGDWYSRKADKAAARAAYARAMASPATRRSAVEQDAWRGALSRSTEEFLRAGALDRAWSELRRWQDEYPVDKIEGYLTLFQARYWAARAKWPRVIALAADLVAINPDSPYADRLVYLAATCEEKLGRTDRARAGYQSLLSDYPGSPLAADARKKVALLAGKHTSGGKRP